jgi:hypothetical protein
VISQPTPSSTTTISDSAPQTDQATTPLFPGSWLQVPPSFEQEPPRSNEKPTEYAEGEEVDRQFISEIRNVHRFDESEETGEYSEGLFRPSKRLEDPIKDPLIDEILASGDADTLLNEYRQMSRSFPLVPIHHEVTSQELHTSKPMLFLAMITATSWRNNKRMKALDAIYRRELAERTIIRPRRTLSLIQSVLVYLSW